MNLPLDKAFLRIGLVGAGATLIHVSIVMFFSAPGSKSPVTSLIMVVLGAMGLLSLVTACIPKLPPIISKLILLAFLAEIAAQTLVWTQTLGLPTGHRLPYLVMTDSALYTDFAATLVQRGENPYGWDYSGVMDLYRTDHAASTPTLTGADESPYPYPALPFVLAIPFQALKLPGTFSVLVISHLLTLALLFFLTPRMYQPLILLPIGVTVNFTGLSLLGSLDIIWIMFLVAMIATWRKPSLRAFFFGLALSYKQGPWLLIPFLLVRIWRDEEDHEPSILRIGRFVAISAATFFLVNGPWIVQSPGAWIEGVTEPLRDNLVILSQGGLSSLTHLGIIYLPKNYYLLSTLAALGLLLFFYHRHYYYLREAFWVFPGIFMWFSYRTLVSYWIYWLFPMLAVLVCFRWHRTEEEIPSGRKWRLTSIVAVSTVGALLLIGGVLGRSSSPISVAIRPPMLVAVGGRVTAMTVDVINKSDRVIAPRFAVQHANTTLNPIAWSIQSGAAILRPGQSDTYEITANGEANTFIVHDTAQLVVTDAGGDYSLRAVASTGLDQSYLWPDAITNPRFSFWADGKPIFWQARSQPIDSGSLSMIHRDGQDAVILKLDAREQGLNYIALENRIVFPSKPFGIWIYSDSIPPNSPARAYGIEIDDGQHRLWILFGPKAYSGPTSAHHVINRLVPENRWVYQEVDLAAAYAEAGWQLPEPRFTNYRSIEAEFRLINFRLLLAVDGPAGQLEAHFGPIIQDKYAPAPEDLMAETLADPVRYYVRLGDSYRQARNYLRAMESYERALQFAHDNTLARSKLQEIRQHLAQPGAPQ
jgi:uncharacterized membrane protein